VIKRHGRADSNVRLQAKTAACLGPAKCLWLIWKIKSPGNADATCRPWRVDSWHIFDRLWSSQVPLQKLDCIWIRCERKVTEQGDNTNVLPSRMSEINLG
jgi:hypothetical protein